VRIIVEGPDGAGKSTLIRGLTTIYPQLEIVRNTMEDKQMFDLWWPQAIGESHDPDIPIHDRFFYSELVYGPVIRGSIKAKGTTIVRTIGQLRRDALLIYCRPMYSTITSNIRGDQMEGVHENIEKLVDEYDYLFSQEVDYYGRRFYLYNWEATTEPDGVTETVRGYLTGELR